MSWKDSEKWAAMRQGIGCPFCADIHEEENNFSYKVAELKQSYVRLPKDQTVRGYVLVALKRHANELFELSPQERAEFFDDVSQVAQAIQTVFHPVKINYMIYGNRCPHVHCHVVPRYVEDDPLGPVVLDKNIMLTEGENQQMLGDIRRALG